MIARLRARHRRMWLVAVAALAVIVIAALALRPDEVLDQAGLEDLRSTTELGPEATP